MTKMLWMTICLAAAGSLPALAAVPSAGTWKVAGDVQGVPVNMSCSLTLADDKSVTGACVDEANKSHTVKGSATEKTITWSFDTEYQGSPITVTMVGTVDDSGAKMAGTIAVDPLEADGEFAATLQPPAMAS